MNNASFVSAPDPLIISQSVPVLNGTASVAAFIDTTGKTLASLPAASPTHIVLPVAGQSNATAVAPTAYTPTHAGHVFNINIFDGRTYAAADPLLGCTRSGAPWGDGNFLGRLADKLITAGPVTDVTFVPIAVGASVVADWNGAALNGYFRTTYARLKMLGIPATAILWCQGEGDTYLSTSQSAYANSLSALIASTRAMGFTCPWFVAKETLYLNAVSSAVQAAQTAIVDHSAGIWAGPNGDSLTGGTYRDTVNDPTNTHFSDAGMDAFADLWKTALQAYGAPF